MIPLHWLAPHKCPSAGGSSCLMTWHGSRSAKNTPTVDLATKNRKVHRLELRHQRYNRPKTCSSHSPSNSLPLRISIPIPSPLPQPKRQIFYEREALIVRFLLGIGADRRQCRIVHTSSNATKSRLLGAAAGMSYRGKSSQIRAW